MSNWEVKMPAIVNETIKENVTSLAGRSFLDAGASQ